MEHAGFPKGLGQSLGETTDEIRNWKEKLSQLCIRGYKIKILNTINFKKSIHYNTFAYIKSEKDILKLVTTFIDNTKGNDNADTIIGNCDTILFSG